MESVKTIRAVERAFAVLEALQTRPDGASLAELQKLTALSKPTLLRMLKTLIDVRAVRRGMVDQKYKTTLQLDLLARGLTPHERLAEIAAPILEDLCQRLDWPSDVLIHQSDDDYMMVLESSLRRSRFYVGRSMGRLRVNLLGSAAGLAFLSRLGEQRYRELKDVARRGSDAHNLKVLAGGDLDTVREQARNQSYAARHAFYRGGGYNLDPRDDNLSAIAVPILGRRHVIGAINVNWNRQARSEADMAKICLQPLTEAAQEIERQAISQLIDEELGHLNRRV